MKFSSYAEYDPQGIALAIPALLTAWSALQRFDDDVVVVGGLVPHLICAHPNTESALPRPATLDVDIGIALGASAGQYGTIQSDLRCQGFVPSSRYPSRLEKKVSLHTVYLDFLVEYDDHRKTKGTVMVDDVVANVLPGVNRALATARSVPLRGNDLFGAEQSLTVRVCEVGPYFALKLRAFGSRQAPKDAFDLLYTYTHYDRGSAQVPRAFRAEADAGNPAFADAQASLQAHFANERSTGPVRAAHFVYGDVMLDRGDEGRLRRLQVQQDAVSMALDLAAAF